jgi:hypothetical protein
MYSLQEEIPEIIIITIIINLQHKSIQSERITMSKRGGELGFSKNQQ